MSGKLKDICRFQSGGTPSKSNAEYFDGNIPWITTVALNGRNIDNNSAIDWITEKAIKESAAKIVPAGSILVGTRVGVGKVAINSIPLSTNQDIISLIDIDDCKWDKSFLCKYLQSKEAFLKDQSRGATIKGIKIDVLGELILPDVDIGTQKRIVKILDHIQDIIDTRKVQVVYLDNLIKARFVEMFGDPEHNNKGWSVKKLRNLCNVGSSKRIYQEEQTIDGIPFWRISDLVTKINTGNVESSLYIPESRYVELKAQGLVPEPGDILVTSRGTLGRCYIVSQEDRFYFQDGMISWLSHYTNEVTPLYIQYLFDMSGFKKQIDNMQAGSTVAYLSIAMLNQLDVMLPSMELQKEFATFVEQVNKSKSVILKSLNETQLLFDSMMQQYFG